MKKLVLTILFLLIATDVFAAEFLHKHVMPSGGDYTSLEACMNANEQDLTGDGWFTVEIDGTWSSADTTTVTIHNYTTTSSDYINIYTTGDARHHGVFSTSHYYIDTGSTAGSQMNFADPTRNVIIDGLQFQRDTATDSSTASQCINYPLGSISGTTVYTVKNCIFKDITQWDDGTGVMTGIICGDSQAAVTIYNCVFFDFKRTSSTNIGVSIGGGVPVVKLYNNTFFNCSVGINQGTAATVTIYNNIFNDCTVDLEHGSYTPTEDYNLTDLTNAASDLDGANDVFETSLTFNNEAGDDFHLASTDTAAIGAGTDLSGTFTDDIDGDTRSGTWDIGADEYVAAATAKPQVIGGEMWL